MSDRMKPLAAGLGTLIAALEKRGQAGVELADKVRAALAGDEKEHVISVGYRNETVVITVDSAAWCPHIRYAQSSVLEKLRAAGETRFTKLKVKVGARITE